MGRLAPEGLCATCAWGGTCLHLKRVATEVHYCEQFELPPFSPGPLPAFGVQQPAPSSMTGHDDPAMGLCRTCERRGTCSLSATVGGVWHCEEFA